MRNLRKQTVASYLRLIPAKREFNYFHFDYDQTKRNYLSLKYNFLKIRYIKEEASKAEEHVNGM